MSKIDKDGNIIAKEFTEGYQAWTRLRTKFTGYGVNTLGSCTSADPCPYRVGGKEGSRTHWWDGWYSHRMEEFLEQIGNKYLSRGNQCL